MNIALEFAGEFETHFTISTTGPGSVENLIRYGQAYGLKCTHIVLQQGATPSQPMLTRHGHGVLSSQIGKARDCAAALNAEGFAVNRIKIEAAPFNEDIPRSNGDALAQPLDRYFEHHIKLLLDGEADMNAIAKIAMEHSAHLSRNAHKIRTDGLGERFVTQRCLRIGQIEARQRLDSLLKDLSPQYDIVDIEEEYVVYDNNLALDSGWLNAERKSQ